MFPKGFRVFPASLVCIPHPHPKILSGFADSLDFDGMCRKLTEFAGKTKNCQKWLHLRTLRFRPDFPNPGLCPAWSPLPHPHPPSLPPLFLPPTSPSLPHVASPVSAATRKGNSKNDSGFRLNGSDSGDFLDFTPKQTRGVNGGQMGHLRPSGGFEIGAIFTSLCQDFF